MVDDSIREKIIVVDSEPSQVPVDKHQQLVENIMYKSHKFICV
jgi:hypothetical protein